MEIEMSTNTLQKLSMMTQNIVPKMKFDSSITYPAAALLLGAAIVNLEWLFYHRIQFNKGEKVVLITGCDSGFGNMLSLHLAGQGYHVISACLTDTGVLSLKNVVSVAVKCDVTNEVEVSHLVSVTSKYIADKNVKLWAVVNNAGIAPLGNIDWMDLLQFRRVMEVNYFGAVSVTKSALPLLKRSSNSRIINLSSVSGVIGAPGFGLYCGSKHALEGVMKVLRMELRSWNIHVSNVNPSIMRTPLITACLNQIMKDFKNAKDELRSQYDEKKIVEVSNLAASLQEDPRLVVKTIDSLLTERYPAFNNYVGKLALLCRISLSIPEFIRDMFEGFIQPSVPPLRNVVESLQG